MRNDRNASRGLGQRLLQWAIAIAGVATILASTGGGSSGPSCAFIIPGAPCTPGGGDPIGPPLPPAPSVSITPTYRVVQAGMPVSFEARAANLDHPTYRWCRAPSLGGNCVPLPDATGSSYTIPSTGMADDGAWFRVEATGTQGTATSGFSALYVSPLPPVVFEDGEFLESDWVVTSSPGPAESAPSFTLSRQATGGNPGAFLSETYNIPGTTGTRVIFHEKSSANYHPSSEGAIHLVEFTIQCRSPVPLTWVTYGLVFEQGGRRFATEDPRVFRGGTYCPANTWRTTGGLVYPQLVAGPPCGSGESCPDFSASAPALVFGLMVVERSMGGGVPTQVTNNYDNWKVSVWRR